MGGEHRAGRDLVFHRGALRVAQPPAAEVHRLGCEIMQFDGVLERRVGVREDFVDDDAVEGQVVGVAR